MRSNMVILKHRENVTAKFCHSFEFYDENPLSAPIIGFLPEGVKLRVFVKSNPKYQTTVLGCSVFIDYLTNSKLNVLFTLI